jgi:hypothetical protein
MRGPRACLTPFVVSLAGLVLGCDGRPAVDSSTTEATVTGTVLIKGKPATSGEIRFNPANVDRLVGPRSAPIGPDGTYTIKTYTGGNQIGFAGSLATENPGLFRFKEYFEVQRGENKKDFDLLNDPQAASGPTKSLGKLPR